MKLSQLISRPAGILVIILFFLPWITISCGAQPIAMSGYDLAAGQVSDASLQSSLESQAQSTGQAIGEPMLFLIPLAGIITIFAAFRLPQTQAKIVYFAAGAVGLLAQILKYFNIQSNLNDFEKQGISSSSVLQFQLAWWLTAITLIAIIAAGYQAHREQGDGP